jgi:hypothetical protein
LIYGKVAQATSVRPARQSGIAADTPPALVSAGHDKVKSGGAWG